MQNLAKDEFEHATFQLLLTRDILIELKLDITIQKGLDSLI